MLNKQLLLRYRRIIGFCIQLSLVVSSFIAAFVLRLDLDVSEIPWTLILKALPLLIVVRMGTLFLFSLHKGLWRYVGVVDLVQIIKASTVSSLAFAAFQIAIFGLEDFPRSVFFLDWAGNIFLLSGVRVAVRLLRERTGSKEDVGRPFQRVLIVGAKDPGVELCKQALGNQAFRFKPVAFVDDEPSNVGTSILGIKVAGLWEDIPEVVTENRVDLAVICLPSAAPAERKSVVEYCQKAGVTFKILPPTPELLDDNVNISLIRDVDPADLLGRPSAKLDLSAVQRFIRGKRVLITGAAGSVGSELSRQIAALQPENISLIDHAENSLLFLESELRESYPDVPQIAQVVDVTNEVTLGRLIAEVRPQIVFHAAAHKHVAFMERSPDEAVKNNVGGTYVLAKCCQAAGVESVVMVSTDKAVKPTSVMGATKRLTELVVQRMNDFGPTCFVSVRFGNVLGSNGSVVPIFRQQIAAGGPITVTHPEVDRYFMSVPEAAGLILQAGSVGTGGEIFILEMGEPVRIVTLAETMITLSGLKPYEEIDIVFTGLRPGEKLTELLYFDNEELRETGYEKLLVLKNAATSAVTLSDVEDFLDSLSTLDGEQVKLRLKNLVPEYNPSPTKAEVVG